MKTPKKPKVQGIAKGSKGHSINTELGELPSQARRSKEGKRHTSCKVQEGEGRLRCRAEETPGPEGQSRKNALRSRRLQISS